MPRCFERKHPKLASFRSPRSVERRVGPSQSDALVVYPHAHECDVAPHYKSFVFVALSLPLFLFSVPLRNLNLVRSRLDYIRLGFETVSRLLKSEQNNLKKKEKKRKERQRKSTGMSSPRRLGVGIIGAGVSHGISSRRGFKG
jgi:hypothetical protein